MPKHYRVEGPHDHPNPARPSDVYYRVFTPAHNDPPYGIRTDLTAAKKFCELEAGHELAWREVADDIWIAED